MSSFRTFFYHLQDEVINEGAGLTSVFETTVYICIYIYIYVSQFLALDHLNRISHPAVYRVTKNFPRHR